VTKFRKKASTSCGFSVQNFISATCLAPRILRWHPDFWKKFCTLQYAQLNSGILKISTSGMGIDILLFGLEGSSSRREHDISVTAWLKKLLNVVTREAFFFFYNLFKLGIMTMSLSFFVN